MFDKVAILELKQILEKLEAQVPFEASVWDETVEEIRSYDSSQSFEADLLACSRMKHAYQLIVELEKTMRPIIARVSKSLLQPSRRFGMEKLPDQLLADIFDISIRSLPLCRREDLWLPIYRTYSQRDRETLILTSKRFSAIVKSTASLWAHTYGRVTDTEYYYDYPPPECKSAPLTANLTTTSGHIIRRDLPNPVHWCHTLLLTMEHQSSSSILDGDALPKEQERVLPWMQSLSIEGSGDPKSFFDTWHTPNLKHLSLRNSLPPRLIAHNLSSLVIRYWPHDMLPPSHIHDAQLVQVLHAAPKLRHLNIDFNYGGAQSRVPTKNEIGLDIDLPHLISLQLSSSFRDPSDTLAFQVVGILTGQMRTPELRHLKLHYTTVQLPSELDQIPFRGKELEKLQTLSLSILQGFKRSNSKPKTGKDVEAFEDEAMKNLTFVTNVLLGQPSLTEVTLFLQKCTKLGNIIEVCPNIRFFRFEGCLLNNVETISEVIKIVHASKPDLQYCDIQGNAFEGRGRKKVRVWLDLAVGPTHFVWKEERWVK